VDNALVDAEADRACGVKSRERNADRRDARTGQDERRRKWNGV